MMQSPEPHTREGALRASDADRERAADALRGHHLDGRLDTDELQERLGRCYAARTTGELAALFADLPGEEPAAEARPRRAAGSPPPLLVVALVALLALATLGALAHGHPGPLPLLAIFLVLRFGRGARRPRAAWGPRG